MVQKVVVIGSGTTSRLGIIRALADVNCDITVIVTSFKDKRGRLNRTKPYDCYSRYINRILYIFAGEKEGLIRLLLDECVDLNQKVILLPDTDFSACIIDEYQNCLSDYFLFPNIHNTPGAIRTWMDKSIQKSLAEELGLHYAKSCEITINNRQYSIPNSIHYPCFTKPKVSFEGGKNYFRKCDDKEQLNDLLSLAGQKGDISIIVEEYVNIETEYALLGFSDGEKVIIPGIIKFICNSKSHFGIAMKGEVLPPDSFESLIEIFKHYIIKVGFIGVFDIDFFWGDEKWWFGELNLRFGGSGYAITKMGVNLPVMLIKFFMGDRWDNGNIKVENAAVFVNERICIDDWYRGFINTKELKKMLNSADISFINDEVDPKPQKAFIRSFMIMWIKRVVKKLRKIF